ncbi:30S ribosomal protein S14 [Saprospira grandis]|uniref:Small ribosomal subunit protein uS14 n=1 Tax=Saprospira grandis (strain Lewin) TaxID=984262 RepID=H6L0N0_SAPGL|nr:30S ribosomal protein S14 [Saprospira grandis]AFC24566.1 SSU ribosomal protein s14p [Saprospira grandis str. Lewin]
MARKSVIAREKKRERLVQKYAARREQLKKEGRWDELDKLPKNSSKVRLHNRCKLTGRPKGYMRQFGLCRVKFREMALAGKIPGVTKASW